MKSSRGMGAVSPSKLPKASGSAVLAKGGWIKDAIKKPGSLKKSLGVAADKKIPSSKLAAAANKPGKMGKRARLAETLKKLGK